MNFLLLELVLQHTANVQTRGRIAQCSRECAAWILRDKAWVTVRAHLIAAFPPWRAIFDGGAERRRRHRKARRVEPLSLMQMIQTYFAPFMDQRFPFYNLKTNREIPFPASFEMCDRELENVYGGLITLLKLPGIANGTFTMTNNGYTIHISTKSCVYNLYRYESSVEFTLTYSTTRRLRRLFFS